MKRSPAPARKTPLKSSGRIKNRKPIRKVSPGTAAEKRRTAHVVNQFCEEHESCALTWQAPGVGVLNVLRLHHICHPNRSNDRRNILRLSDLVHRHYHTGAEVDENGERLPEITIGDIIWPKRESDPEWFDLDWLRKKKGNLALEPEPIDPFYLELRERA